MDASQPAPSIVETDIEDKDFIDGASQRSDQSNSGPETNTIATGQSPDAESLDSNRDDDSESDNKVIELVVSPSHAKVHPLEENDVPGEEPRKKRRKKKSKQAILEETLQMHRDEVERRQMEHLGASVLQRTGFAMNAWLQPDTAQKQRLRDARHQRKLMERRKRSPSDEQALHQMSRFGYCWKVRAEVNGRSITVSQARLPCTPFSIIRI
jgi:hypothetical protein